jgi:hypothetical protein
VTCRSHDWKPELLHTNPAGRPYAIDYLCRKCGKWRLEAYDAEAWRAHAEDVIERLRWDALLGATAAK